MGNKAGGAGKTETGPASPSRGLRKGLEGGRRFRENTAVFIRVGAFFLFLALLGSFFFHASPAGAATAGETAIFTDIQDHWAESHITRLASLEVIKGYPDRTFRPERLTTGLEAMVLIMRSGGFASEVKTKPAASRPGAKNKAPVKPPAIPVPWGQEFIDLAVEKGFLTAGAPDEFNHAGPASRLQVARFLARALYLVPPALQPGFTAETGFTIDRAFTDEESLGPADRVCLKAVAGAEVMSGYPDGSFRPDQPLTRAELAAILSRLVDRGWVKTAAGRRTTGWISEIKSNRGQLELELSSTAGKQKLRLAKNVNCYRQGKKWPVERSGNFLSEIIRDGRGQVCWINLLEERDRPEKLEKIRGSVKSAVLGTDNLLIINDLDCRDQTLPLAWDAEISGKNARDFKSLKAGAFVDVETYKGQVKKVTLLEVKTVSGKVRSVGRRLYLEDGLSSSSSGKPGWFNNWDRARIVDKEGRRTEGVLAGEKVDIVYIDPYPGEIDDEIPLEIKVSR
ncbi:MAG: S-layer homology domain-containing protein [Peptococcaceae bacterium]|nr:S-layer homology domain-containing protein [Peptococcaceae bacterium]